MKRTTFALAGALPAALLLAACGDDLEARNDAVSRDEGSVEIIDADSEFAPMAEDFEGRMRIEDLPESQRAGQVEGSAAERVAIPLETEIPQRSTIPRDAIEVDADTEETVVDASPEDLMDTTEGFAPDPLDDAAGIDPAPINPDPLPQ